MNKALKFFINLIPIKQIRHKLRRYFDSLDFFRHQDRKSPASFAFPIFETPKVTIVIPAYNQFKYTKSCLWSILNNTQDIPYEILIADDFSTDQTKNIKDCIKNITVIRQSKNEGFLINVQSALPKAKGEYIVLMNNDIFVKKDWLKYLLETIENDKTVGYVGGKYLSIDDKIQEAGSRIDKNGTTGWLGYKEDVDSPEFNQPKEVDYCSACCVMFKKDTWEQVGGFDEQFYPAYFEDTDLCFKIKYNLGLKIMYQPKSEVYHHHCVSHSLKNSELLKANKQKFLNKWIDKLSMSSH